MLTHTSPSIYLSTFEVTCWRPIYLANLILLNRKILDLVETFRLIGVILNTHEICISGHCNLVSPGIIKIVTNFIIALNTSGSSPLECSCALFFPCPILHLSAWGSHPPAGLAWCLVPHSGISYPVFLAATKCHRARPCNCLSVSLTRRYTPPGHGLWLSELEWPLFSAAPCTCRSTWILIEQTQWICQRFKTVKANNN